MPTYNKAKRTKANTSKWVFDPFHAQIPSALTEDEASPCSGYLEFDTKEEIDAFLATLLPEWTHPETGEEYSNAYCAPLMGFGPRLKPTPAEERALARAIKDFNLEDSFLLEPGENLIGKYLKMASA